MISIENIENNYMNGLLPGNPFVNKNWLAHLFASNYFFDDHELDCLFNAINQISDSKKCYSVSYFHPEVFVEFDADKNSFLKKVQPNSILHSGMYMYDDSLKWGVVCTSDEINVIGGTPEFIAVLEKEFGGKESIIKNYIIWYKDFCNSMNKNDKHIIDAYNRTFFEIYLIDVNTYLNSI